MEMDGITKKSIAKSLDLMLNRKMVFKAGEGGGASGSFFFFSHDNKFLIKTMSKSEKRLFLGMLDDYISHIQNSNNKSLLARIYGIFNIHTNEFGFLNVMFMQNVSILKGKCLATFDLKGSTIKRRTNIPMVHSNKKMNYYNQTNRSQKILKDINFLELNRNSKRPILRLNE